MEYVSRHEEAAAGGCSFFLHQVDSLNQQGKIFLAIRTTFNQICKVFLLLLQGGSTTPNDQNMLGNLDHQITVYCVCLFVCFKYIWNPRTNIFMQAKEISIANGQILKY